jgi:hypothetical protein
MIKNRHALISTLVWVSLSKERQKEAIQAVQEAVPAFAELYPEISREDATMECAWSLGFHHCLMCIESGLLVPTQWHLQLSAIKNEAQ